MNKRQGIFCGKKRRIFIKFQLYKRYLSAAIAFYLFLISGGIAASQGGEKIYSPVAVSNGNMLYSPENPLENQLYLGGALGAFQRPGFYGGYNRVTGANEYWGSFFLRQSEGVFGVTYLHSAHDPAKNLSNGLLHLGFGKSLTENLSFGFFLNYVYNDLTHLTSTIGFEPSIIYSINPSVKPGRVIAVHNFFIYSALRQLNFYNSAGEAMNPVLHLGLGAKFLKIKNFYAGVQTEGALDSGMNIKIKTSPIAFGINLGYSIFQLRAAYRLEIPFNGVKPAPGNFSLGGGLHYDFSGISLEAQYGVSGFETGKPGHHIALGAIFNYDDKIAPALKVTVDHDQFSPNGDGVRDYVVFHISVIDLSPIRQWRLVIKNAKGDIVRTFEKDQRMRSVYFPAYRIFTDLFKRSEYRYVPESVTWDGTSDKLNTTASPVSNPPAIKLPEGSYFYEMTVTDAKGMSVSSPVGTIIMDNTYPDIILKRDAKSENRIENKSARIFLAVSQFTSTQIDETFTGTVYNESGSAVRTWIWKGGANLPKLFTWDGLNRKGRFVQEGSYRYELRAEDAAGNQTAAQIAQVNVSYGDKYLDVISQSEGFSPNGDGLSDTINFSMVNGDNSPGMQKDMTSWKVYLTHEKFFEHTKNPINVKELKKLDSLDYVRLWTGDKNNFLIQQTWDGKNKYGKPVSDGFYYLTLVVKYADSSVYKSGGTRIALDTTAPETVIFPQLDTITPDGDGIDDDEFLRASYNDQSEIKNYTLTLYEVLYINGVKVRVAFKTWSGKNAIPDKFYFNGVSDHGLNMESLKEYEYDIEAADVYDNKVKKTAGRFYTGVLVNHSGSNMKITLTGLSDRDGINLSNMGVLNRIYDVLTADYPNYRIRVEGHTGNGGDEESNVQTSEQRAKNIMRYFINKGMPSDRIGFQGFGEILPLTEVDNEINNYKNDRVEFILLK